MKHTSSIFILIILLGTLTFSCDNSDLHTNCTVAATVRDLSGLDGCGFVFELNDGTRLIPVWEFGWCGTPPLPKEVTNDPLYNFEFVDGKKVFIGFTERNDMATICMAGKSVKITCLKEVSGSSF